MTLLTIVLMVYRHICKGSPLAMALHETGCARKTILTFTSPWLEKRATYTVNRKNTKMFLSYLLQNAVDYDKIG